MHATVGQPPWSKVLEAESPWAVPCGHWARHRQRRLMSPGPRPPRPPGTSSAPCPTPEGLPGHLSLSLMERLLNVAEGRHKTPLYTSKMSSGGTSTDKISIGTYISLHLPSEFPALPTSNIESSPVMAGYEPVINSTKPPVETSPL